MKFLQLNLRRGKEAQNFLMQTARERGADVLPGIAGVPNESFKEVIGAFPEILLEAFNSCFLEGRFFVDWKKQRLVLLRKRNKPLGDASSYGPICLFNTMGNLLDELILQRRQGHIVGENSLSENELGFRKGRSTVDEIKAVVDIATKARRGAGNDVKILELRINDSLWRAKSLVG